MSTAGTRTKAIIGGASILLASASMVYSIRQDEGREYTPYRDIVNVLTVCDGITGTDVIPGKTYTDQECNALTIKNVEKHGSELLDCIHVRITQPMYEALAGWAFNVGTGAACKSTAIKLINQGKYYAGCKDILRWDKAGGRTVRGLTLRRQRDSDACIKGIPEQAKAIA